MYIWNNQLCFTGYRKTETVIRSSKHTKDATFQVHLKAIENENKPRKPKNQRVNEMLNSNIEITKTEALT